MAKSLDKRQMRVNSTRIAIAKDVTVQVSNFKSYTKADVTSNKTGVSLLP